MYEYHEDGYRVTSDDSTKMTVVIDSVILEQAGNYSCKMLRVRGEDVRYCSLEVKGRFHLVKDFFGVSCLEIHL